MGNICRSPAAEGIMQHFVSAKELAQSVRIDSAGTINSHAGELADRRMRESSAKRGYKLESRARQVVSDDFQKFDLIVAMDRANRDWLLRKSSNSTDKIRLLSEFLSSDWPIDVPDPYYGDDAGFEFVIEMLEAAVPGIVDLAAKAVHETNTE
jgi:protein-tyrosine phosphatase